MVAALQIKDRDNGVEHGVPVHCLAVLPLGTRQYGVIQQVNDGVWREGVLGRFEVVVEGIGRFKGRVHRSRKVGAFGAEAPLHFQERLTGKVLRPRGYNLAEVINDVSRDGLLSEFLIGLPRGPSIIGHRYDPT
jgi:hypothetical protein